MSETWLQITAGQGPAECALAVLRVAERVRAEAAEQGIPARVVEAREGPVAGTAESILIALGARRPRRLLPVGWARCCGWGGVRSGRRTSGRTGLWGWRSCGPVTELQFCGGRVAMGDNEGFGSGRAACEPDGIGRAGDACAVGVAGDGQRGAESASEPGAGAGAAWTKFAEAEGRAPHGPATAREERWRARGRLERGNPVRTLRE